MKTALLVVVGLIAGPAIAQPEASTNLLANPGFEESPRNDPAPPVGWERYSTAKVGSSVTGDAHLGGQQCLKLSSQGVPRAFQGLIQRIAVVSGEKYTFAASVMNDERDPLKGMAYLQLCVEWQNAEGREVSRHFTPPQGQTVSKTRWTLLEVRKVKAPPGAVRAVVGIHLYEGERGGKGCLFVDDAWFGLLSPLGNELAKAGNTK
jgi:hypothetical protein